MDKNIRVPLEIKTFKVDEEKKTVEWEAVIFSSEFNRNKAFFDVTKMNRWSKKLEKIQFNDNHNGKYFSTVTDKIVEFKIVEDESGAVEALAKIQSTNPEKVLNPEKVTGFSIEIQVDKNNVIKNENGEYYKDYEWVGVAYLKGQLAGSGDTRILSLRTFSMVEEEIEEQTPSTPPVDDNKTEEIEELRKQFEELKAFKLAKEEEETKEIEELKKQFSEIKNWKEVLKTPTTTINQSNQSTKSVGDLLVMEK
jgi:hypothetical protein